MPNALAKSYVPRATRMDNTSTPGLPTGDRSAHPTKAALAAAGSAQSGRTASAGAGTQPRSDARIDSADGNASAGEPASGVVELEGALARPGETRDVSDCRHAGKRAMIRPSEATTLRVGLVGSSNTLARISIRSAIDASPSAPLPRPALRHRARGGTARRYHPRCRRSASSWVRVAASRAPRRRRCPPPCCSP